MDIKLIFTCSNLMYGGPQQPAFASVMTQFGLVHYKDLNGGTPNCVSFTPNACLNHFCPRITLTVVPLQSINPQDSDHRSSSASAYLTPVESRRKGWTILVGHQVTKILFVPNTGAPRTATGVQFGTSSGATYTAYARKEVILAAGAIGVSSGIDRFGWDHDID